MIGKSAMDERAAGSFVPRTPPKPGFSIRAFDKRRQQKQFVSKTPPKPGFSIRAFVERNKLKEKCAVCLETSSRTDFKTLGCNHRFHRNCLETMLKNGQRTCPLCRANINNSWLAAEEMAHLFISDVVDELLDDMLVEFISDDDDVFYRYGSEYYGSEIYSSDYDDRMTVIHSDYHDSYLAEVEGAIAEDDVFELLDLGLQRLFDESNLSNQRLGRDRYLESYTSSDTSNDIAEHRRIDVYELGDLGIDRLFDESIHRDSEQSNDSIYRYFAWLDANDDYLDYW